MGLVALAAVGCQAPQVGSIDFVTTGVVIAVDGPNAAQVDRVTIRTDTGSTVSLAVGPLELSNGGLPAPHLREHMVSGEPITAYARNNVMFRYTDAAQ